MWSARSPRARTKSPDSQPGGEVALDRHEMADEVVDRPSRGRRRRRPAPTSPPGPARPEQIGESRRPSSGRRRSVGRQPSPTGRPGARRRTASSMTERRSDAGAASSLWPPPRSHPPEHPFVDGDGPTGRPVRRATVTSPCPPGIPSTVGHVTVGVAAVVRKTERLLLGGWQPVDRPPHLVGDVRSTRPRDWPHVPVRWVAARASTISSLACRLRVPSHDIDRAAMGQHAEIAPQRAAVGIEPLGRPPRAGRTPPGSRPRPAIGWPSPCGRCRRRPRNSGRRPPRGRRRPRRRVVRRGAGRLPGAHGHVCGLRGPARSRVHEPCTKPPFGSAPNHRQAQRRGGGVLEATGSRRLPVFHRAMRVDSARLARAIAEVKESERSVRARQLHRWYDGFVGELQAHPPHRGRADLSCAAAAGVGVRAPDRTDRASTTTSTRRIDRVTTGDRRTGRPGRGLVRAGAPGLPVCQGTP